ncbi:MAG TPA: glycerate kinase [Anaerolineae bacterium]|nr:glycerate kinase [Anaerolineae bacterium]
MSLFDPRLLNNEESREKRRKILPILSAALQAVDPVAAVKRHVSLERNKLRIGDHTYDLRQYEHIYVVGGGKAGGSMARAIEGILGDRITAGVVNTKYGYLADTRMVRINEAGHPIPDAQGMSGAREMLDLAKGASEGDLVLCLISGGGSALMTLPVEGISLKDMEALTSALLRCGATINEINTIRKHLSQIKGGNLARAAFPAEVVSLILSDVVGNPLDVIASGPTVPDSSSFTQSLEIVERYNLVDDLPAPIIEQLRRGKDGEIEETPKQGDPVFASTYNLIVGSNEIAARAAMDEARDAGLHTLLLSTYVEGEAREVAHVFCAIAKEILHSGQPVPRPACVVAGGETTVTIRGEGRGGRNQELALSAAIRLDGMDEVVIVALATDGTDGPTDAAGAIADGSTLRRARAKKLLAREHLANNDSYHFFDQLDDLLITGPTNTNVNDLTFVFVF